MGKFNSKAKGGGYEHIIAKKISHAFKAFGIHEDDCYRTKNSGATKSQPGDLQLSPALAKIFPATVECKHFRKVNYTVGRPLHTQPKSFHIRIWWEQVMREQLDAPSKFGLLIFRENNCPDMCAFAPDRLKKVFRERSMLPLGVTRYSFAKLCITSYKQEEIWMLPLSDFLLMYVLHLRWFTFFYAIQAGVLSYESFSLHLPADA